MAKNIKKTSSRKKTTKKAVKINNRKKPLQITKTNRAKIDPSTGQVISRRQYDKKYGRTPRIAKQKGYSPRAYQHKLDLYKLIRDDFIEHEYDECLKRKKKNKNIVCVRMGKREAMNSPELKKIIRDLKSKNSITKADALARTGRITPDQIEYYANLFASE